MKKNFVKIIAVLLVVLMFAGCGNSGGVSAPTSDPGSGPNTPASNNPATNTPSDPAPAEAAWPSGDVTIITPSNAGSGTDTVARLIADSFKASTGKNVIVVNDNTGGNTVAYETVRNSEPDGTTLLFYQANLIAQIATGQYNESLDSFKIIGNCNDSEKFGMGLYVNADSPFETVNDLVEYAKENPGELLCGVETNGQDHYVSVLMMDTIGFEATVVSAGGGTEKIPLLMGGNVDFCFLPPPSTNDYVISGDLKCLAVCGTERSALMPETPTVRECGYDWDCLGVVGNMFIAGPAGLSDEICEAIYACLQTANQDQNIKDSMSKMNMTWTLDPVEETRAQLAEKMETYTNAIALIQGQ